MLSYFLLIGISKFTLTLFGDGILFFHLLVLGMLQENVGIIWKLLAWYISYWVLILLLAPIAFTLVSLLVIMCSSFYILFYFEAVVSDTEPFFYILSYTLCNFIWLLKGTIFLPTSSLHCHGTRNVSSWSRFSHCYSRTKDEDFNWFQVGWEKVRVVSQPNLILA